MFCWGGGNSNIFGKVHPEILGKMNPFGRAYFSNGWFNHQLVLVDVSKVVSLLHLVDKPWKTSDVGVNWLMFFVDVSNSIVTLCYDVHR